LHLVTSLVASLHSFHHLSCWTNAGVTHLTSNARLQMPCVSMHTKGAMSCIHVDSDALDPDARTKNVQVPNCISSSRLMTEADTWLVSRAPPVCIHMYIGVYIHISQIYAHTHTHTHTHTNIQTNSTSSCTCTCQIHSITQTHSRCHPRME